jgi:hypothetical protein
MGDAVETSGFNFIMGNFFVLRGEGWVVLGIVLF